MDLNEQIINVSLQRLKDALKNYDGNWIIKEIISWNREIRIVLEFESKKGYCSNIVLLSSDGEKKRDK